METTMGTVEMHRIHALATVVRMVDMAEATSPIIQGVGSIKIETIHKVLIITPCSVFPLTYCAIEGLFLLAPGGYHNSQRQDSRLSAAEAARKAKQAAEDAVRRQSH